jgi:dUTP pyrophosphatase
MPKDTFFASLKRYEIGDRVGQLIIMPYPTIEVEEAKELSESDRGEGGFGSTGK